MSRWPRWTRWPGGVLVGPRKDTTAIARTHVIVRLNHFNLTDIVPVGYAIFAVALGICAGTLQRRTLPALAVTWPVSPGCGWPPRCGSGCTT
jgi:hypothetical protein